MEIKTRKMWSGAEEALSQLGKNFSTDSKKYIYKKHDYVATDLDYSAIYYLHDNWEHHYVG